MERRKGDDIASRLLELGANCIHIASTLPNTVHGKHIVRQLTRSSTAGGANYEEVWYFSFGEFLFHIINFSYVI